MIFDNEIVKNGKVDIYGQPITGNVPQTLHRGVEFSVNLKLNEGISVFGNATYSKNEIKDGKYYINATDIIDLSSNRISGFPDFLANAGVTYKQENYFVQITGKYVGKFYSDNYDENLNKYLNAFPGFVSYSDNVNDAYFNADMIASYQFYLFNSLTSSKVYFQINNIFDKLYSANAIGGEFFPAANRNFLAGLEIGL
jgi:iron complex outermembrane receptor protein